MLLEEILDALALILVLVVGTATLVKLGLSFVLAFGTTVLVTIIAALLLFALIT